jgi:hypothetical protein
LSIGLILAIFSVLGNWPLSNALFIIRFRGVARAAADMFINLDGISSKPEDFFGLIDFISLQVFSLLMFFSVNVLDCLSLGSRKVLKSYLFSCFSCDLVILLTAAERKYSQNMFAISSLFVTTLLSCIIDVDVSFLVFLPMSLLMHSQTFFESLPAFFNSFL